MNEMKIITSEAIEAINKSEIDVSIATAKAYPRSMKSCIDECLTIATMTKETAQECFYAVPRAGKTIEGPSVRLAEILVHSWGNINSGFRIIGNDGKKITAQAICHDLEKNVRITAESTRKITSKTGQTFSDDMQIMTGNAAAKIAFRNAVFTCIPKAVTAEIQAKIKRVALGSIKDTGTAIKNLKDYFTGLGATDKEILKMVNLNSFNEMTIDHIFTLGGVKTAITEGTITTDEAFGRIKGKKPVDEKAVKESDELSQAAMKFNEKS